MACRYCRDTINFSPLESVMLMRLLRSGLILRAFFRLAIRDLEIRKKGVFSNFSSNRYIFVAVS